MPVVVHIVIRGITPAQYDAVRRATDWVTDTPDGALSHVTWWQDGDCHNLDAWESEEAFAAFAKLRLGPGMARAGATHAPEVTLHPAHEVIAPRVVTQLATPA